MVAGVRRGSNKPPTISASKTFAYVMRYTMGSAGVITISIDDLLDNYFVASASNAGLRVFSAVKLRKVEAWGPAYTGASPVNLVFTWLSENSGTEVGAPSQAITDTSVAFNDCPHICVTPPPNTACAQWLSATVNADKVFAIVAPANTVVDIHFTGVLAEGAVGGGTPQNAVGRSVAGATAGQLYTSYLPPSAGATGLTPVSGAFI